MKFFQEKMNDFLVCNEDEFFLAYIPARMDTQTVEYYLEGYAKKNGSRLLWFRGSDAESVTFNYERKRLFH